MDLSLKLLEQRIPEISAAAMRARRPFEIKTFRVRLARRSCVYACATAASTA